MTVERQSWTAGSRSRSTKAVFTMTLEPELRDMFMADAATDDRPVARDDDEFVRRKVEVARRQRDAGLHVSNEEVDADAAARRADLLRRIREAGV